MCYNLKSSIVAYVLATTSVYFMYLRNFKFDKFIGPFVFAYSFVQLAEGFMWYDNKCGELNRIGGYIAYYSLSSHVLAMGISLYLINKNPIGLIIGILTVIYQTYNLPQIDCSKKKGGKLDWGFDYGGFYKWFVVLIIILASMIKINYKYKIIFFSEFAFLWFYFFHKHYNIKNIYYLMFEPWESNRFGSEWCWTAFASAPLLYLLGDRKLFDI